MSTTTPPCTRCGTLVGLAWRDNRVGQDPRRADGAHYGVPGLLCFTCYGWAKRQPGVRQRDRVKSAAYRATVLAARKRAVALATANARRREESGTAALPINGRLAALVLPRVAVVREAKRIKASLGMCPDLTDDELDAVLPPVDCQRTRERMAKGAGSIFRNARVVGPVGAAS